MGSRLRPRNKTNPFDRHFKAVAEHQEIRVISRLIQKHRLASRWRQPRNTSRALCVPSGGRPQEKVDRTPVGVRGGTALGIAKMDQYSRLARPPNFLADSERSAIKSGRALRDYRRESVCAGRVQQPTAPPD